MQHEITTVRTMAARLPRQVHHGAMTGRSVVKVKLEIDGHRYTCRAARQLQSLVSFSRLVHSLR